MNNGIEKIKGYILLKGGRVYDPFLSIDKQECGRIVKNVVLTFEE